MANHRTRIEKPESTLRGTLDFLDRNWQAVAVILGIIAVFVWYQALGLGGSAGLQQAITGVSTGIKEAAQQLAQTAPPTPAVPQETAVPEIPSTFTQTAVAGQGVTHLARQALDEYLTAAAPDVTLTREHKIYIEDYLKDQIGSRGLNVGEELSFSTSSITQAIELSQTLTQAQLANLTKYANRVPSLQGYQPIQ